MLSVPERGLGVLEARGRESLAEMFIVSEVELLLAPDDVVGVRVERASGEKCPRCWNLRPLGDDGLCARCSDVVASLR